MIFKFNKQEKVLMGIEKDIYNSKGIYIGKIRKSKVIDKQSLVTLRLRSDIFYKLSSEDLIIIQNEIKKLKDVEKKRMNKNGIN